MLRSRSVHLSCPANMRPSVVVTCSVLLSKLDKYSLPSVASAILRLDLLSVSQSKLILVKLQQHRHTAAELHPNEALSTSRRVFQLRVNCYNIRPHTATALSTNTEATTLKNAALSAAQHARSRCASDRSQEASSRRSTKTTVRLCHIPKRRVRASTELLRPTTYRRCRARRLRRVGHCQAEGASTLR